MILSSISQIQTPETEDIIEHYVKNQLSLASGFTICYVKNDFNTGKDLKGVVLYSEIHQQEWYILVNLEEYQSRETNFYLCFYSDCYLQTLRPLKKSELKKELLFKSFTSSQKALRKYCQQLVSQLVN